MNNNNSQALTALSVMDFTRLTENDNEQAVIEFVKGAVYQGHQVAAVCVYPEYITVVRETLNQMAASTCKIATVVNFPAGDQSTTKILADIENAVKLGADEIDYVIPYQQLLAGNRDYVAEQLTAVRQACQNQCLKVILETGELITQQLIDLASDLAIAAGADFLKTSTGKVTLNATLAATEVMNTAIIASGKSIGIKPSGGINTLQQAIAYIEQAQSIQQRVVNSSWFRLGASRLLADLKQYI